MRLHAFKRVLTQWYFWGSDRRIDLNLSKSTQSAAGVEGFEACCQWALLNVKISTLLFPFTVQKYIYHPVSKVHAESVRVSIIHRTLTWTTGSLTCARDQSHGGGHTDSESAQYF